MREDFEGAFPGSWTVGDANFEGEDAYWADVNLNSFGSPPVRSTWAGYCAGAGYGGTEFGPEYQDDMQAIIAKTIDLRGYSSATLTFWHIIPSIESGVDACFVTIDQTDVYARSSPLSSWAQQTINLTPYVGATHTLSFQFFSDSSLTAEGWYLDDIVVTGVGKRHISSTDESWMVPRNLLGQSEHADRIHLPSGNNRYAACHFLDDRPERARNRRCDSTRGLDRVHLFSILPRPRAVALLRGVSVMGRG